ncbi:hypothetical protein [Ferruginivarius sediminum]|uniref:Uncharacterized protein n=1 Tax=Ferruginivarius sediminum TaxID=2661937 RepID=A0A369T6V5_9PROT|nr:hypothetical protein [Ferruginivarius sediminum]RDD61061.1 hypothetical protein DRB17_15170 [Ferruginivarius sediminum]
MAWFLTFYGIPAPHRPGMKKAAANLVAAAWAVDAPVAFVGVYIFLEFRNVKNIFLFLMLRRLRSCWRLAAPGINVVSGAHHEIEKHGSRPYRAITLTMLIEAYNQGANNTPRASHGSASGGFLYA